MKLFDRLGKLRDRRRPYCTMIVPAAGESRRMGGGNKLLLPLEGEPVLAHTLRAIDAATLVDEIILSTRTECLAEMAELCRRCGLQKPVRVVVGGETRTHSVLAAALGCVLTRQSVAALRYDPGRLAALLTGRSRQETEVLLRQAAEVFIRGAGCPEGLSAYLRRSVPVLAGDVTRAVSLGHPEAVLPLPVEL